MTKYSQSSESTNPVEFSIPDDFYHIPEVFDLDLDLDLDLVEKSLQRQQQKRSPG